MSKHPYSCEFTTDCIREFSLELAGMALRAGVEADLFNHEFDSRGLPLHQGSFPATVTFPVSRTVSGVANFERSESYVILGRVKYFSLYKMAWRNEDSEFDNHTPIATVKFLYDQQQRRFLGESSDPALTFQLDAIDEICGIGVLPPYKTPRRATA